MELHYPVNLFAREDRIGVGSRGAGASSRGSPEA